jgi:hypothetical protein
MRGSVSVLHVVPVAVCGDRWVALAFLARGVGGRTIRQWMSYVESHVARPGSRYSALGGVGARHISQ